MIKFLKFWWEYNEKKWQSENEFASFIFYICLVFVAIGMVLYLIFGTIPESIRDWRKERKKFWNEYRKTKS